MRLLLNADDLGYTPVINQAIFNLHNRRRLFSTSLLVNLPYSQNAIDGLNTYPDLQVGVHLNLTKGCPILSPEQIPSLVTNVGKFWPTKRFYARAVTGRINLLEAETELRAQIERVLDFGIHPTHLDSHSHWHLLPHLRRIVNRLRADYQIQGMRQAAFRRTLLPSRFWLAAATHKPLPKPDIRIPHYMLSLHQWMGADGRPRNLFFSKELRRLIAHPETTLELVTHPGNRDDPYFPPDTLLTHQRQWEYGFLLNARFDTWLEMMNAQIITYMAL